MRRSRAAMPALWLAAAMAACLPASAGPGYDSGRVELEAVLHDLEAWLPGAWDSYPQIHFERRFHRPAEGEHDHWHRSFARIDAPQLGPVVFYGQINVGGRDGPLLPRSQILYVAGIDEARSAVNMNGQPPLDAEDFVNLHERPELWRRVQMRDRSAINCDFLWRRKGTQLVAVLDGKTDERRAHGPGTCSYPMGGSDVEFFADAEWVLGPDELWVYDINTIGGRRIVGREDRTHIRLYRARGYRCSVKDRDGTRDWPAHDRGARTPVWDADGEARDLMLLRAPLPSLGGGLDDHLRLSLLASGDGDEPLYEAQAPAGAATVSLQRDGIDASCRQVAELPPLGPGGSSAASAGPAG